MDKTSKDKDAILQVKISQLNKGTDPPLIKQLLEKWELIKAKLTSVHRRWQHSTRDMTLEERMVAKRWFDEQNLLENEGDNKKLELKDLIKILEMEKQEQKQKKQQMQPTKTPQAWLREKAKLHLLSLHKSLSPEW